MTRPSHTAPNRLWLVPLLCLALTSCGGAGSKNQPVVEINNDYIAAAKNFMRNGLSAMQHERWMSAERAFERALTSAQLADDMPLIIHAWYNLAVTRASMADQHAAQTAYQQCMQLSKRHSDKLMHMRASLALALMQAQASLDSSDGPSGKSSEKPFEPANWPADIQLQAARLAQLRQQPQQARAAYHAVINSRNETKALLHLKAQAHMGLALLARTTSQPDLAWQQAEQALMISHRSGQPRLAAHALLLQARLVKASAVAATNPELRSDKLQRALDIYTALQDIHGQQQSLTLLLELAQALQKPQIIQRYQLRLQALEAKLGKQTP